MTLGDWADPTLTKVGNTRRLTSNHNRRDASVYDAASGGGWIKLARSDDISGFQHTVFGGFVSARPGIYAIGPGSAEFHSMRYRGFQESYFGTPGILIVYGYCVMGAVKE